MPLVLTHGWPGSFFEMLAVIPMLTDPGTFGIDSDRSFDVVVPSLPGFGFSSRARQRGMNTFRIAELWAALMSELGYARFGVQGGDFGANVATVLALQQPDRIVGVHLNYIPGSYAPHITRDDPLHEDERHFLAEVRDWADQNGGYAHVQRTEPTTLAYGLNDSPVGLAAWIIDKFRRRSDCNGDVESRFTRDQLLANVTLYWVTETITSSCRLYFESSRAPLRFAAGEFVRAPTAIARFPMEAPFPPRRWVERGYNVQRWTEMPRGGHFAAMEEPRLLAHDIREFFRALASS
jgi:pimeloyl-ACP methyl ester carboxylesterase